MKILNYFQYGNLLGRGNQYYILGLALQKGLPIIVIPILIHKFGISAYSQYVLIFTLIQIYANLSSLAVPQVLIPLWFRQNREGELSSSAVALILILALLSVIPGIPLLLLAQEYLQISLSSFELIFWVILFSIILNFHSLAIGLVRVRGRHKQFFYASLIGGLVFLFIVFSLDQFPEASLALLVGIQALTFICSFVVLILKDYRFLKFKLNLSGFGDVWPVILRQSMPMCIYSCVALFAMSVDKWIIRIWHESEVFNQYVLDMQLAYSIILVPSAVTLGAAPVISKLVAAKDYDGIGRLENQSRQVIIYGSILMSVLVAIYAWLTGLNLSLGYLILVIGYLYEGQYMMKSIRVMSELQSGYLAWLILGGSLFLLLMLIVACNSKEVLAIYFCVPLYSIVMFYMARKAADKFCYSQ